LRKRALITGITGQDGSYLAELLLAKGYEVHGLRRRASSYNAARIAHLCDDPQDAETRLFLHYGDMADSTTLIRAVEQAQPDEVYNLAAQSHVAVSFEMPEYTADVGGMGTLRLLEAVRTAGLHHTARFFQASTSELFGAALETPQRETTAFHPRSPYGIAKLFAYWSCINYREAYGMYACNGIMFNHESPLRGETFVSRKITRAVARIEVGLQDTLYLGNLDVRRDWGHARDYVRAQWLILQQPQAADYVIATGEQHSVRQLTEYAFAQIGVKLEWRGDGVDEVGLGSVGGMNRPKRVLVAIDPSFFRPAEVNSLQGDSSLARQALGWRPQITFEQLVAEMVAEDLKQARRDAARSGSESIVTAQD
jgi:GDPmannose 4,6-dehydratase